MREKSHSVAVNNNLSMRKDKDDNYGGLDSEPSSATMRGMSRSVSERGSNSSQNRGQSASKRTRYDRSGTEINTVIGTFSTENRRKSTKAKKK